MHVKKMMFLCVGFGILLLVTSCAPSFEQRDEVVEENQDETSDETAIIPRYNISDENYRMLIDNKLSKARGVIVNQVANRLDIDEFEEGLRRHSKEHFSTDDYYFQEGQYISDDIVYDWLERYSDEEQSSSNPLGLNPEIEDETSHEQQQDNPKYLSHVLEQNYLRRTEDDGVELGGVSIGIAMKSVYRYQVEEYGDYFFEDIPQDEMLSEANKVAKEVLQRIREDSSLSDLSDVPVMIAIYREEDRASIVPGNFVAKTYVPADRSTIDNWESVNEEYILFPSSTARQKYPDISTNLSDFESDVADYFPNYVSVIGKGFYINEQLQKLSIEIPISFNGKAEVIGFTQYVYGLVTEGFQNYYDLEINITSSGDQESLISRKAGEEEPFVHVYN
ncbi:CamS family sex pheromone protein [Aquibacillus sediminis]|uniref:CamS family sex pheromone protein n=1 Tax=Aquibacillus sediminis TaxID=2574734 RepID=UPI001108524A|nr:CamS family sex pheromone protein [Aquibacillus sediminis]